MNSFYHPVILSRPTQQWHHAEMDNKRLRILSHLRLDVILCCAYCRAMSTGDPHRMNCGHDTIVSLY